MIALIIPAFNEEVELPMCLTSLAAQKNKNFKLILVSNGSTDSTKEIMDDFAKSRSIDTMVLEEPRIGKLNALKTAIKYIEKDPKIDVIAFSDADSYFSSDWSQNVQSFFQKSPNISYGYTTEMFKGDLLKNIPNFKVALDKYTNLLYFTRSKIGGFMNLGNCFVRKDVFLKVGGFGNWEKSSDTLLTLKLISSGYKGKYCNAKVWFSPRRILDNNLEKWCNDQDIRKFITVNGFRTWTPIRENKLLIPTDISKNQIESALKIRGERLVRRLIILYIFKKFKILGKFDVKLTYPLIDKIVRKVLKKEIGLGGKILLQLQT